MKLKVLCCITKSSTYRPDPWTFFELCWIRVVACWALLYKRNITQRKINNCKNNFWNEIFSKDFHFSSSSFLLFFVRRFFPIFLVLFHHQYLLSFPFFISFISITKLHSFFTSFSWDYFPHDHARSRAYRWGEDGLLGISDEECRLCFGLALWNEKDPILKERLFGLTGNEGTISVIILNENILE